MIRNTHELAPQHTVVAYSDNRRSWRAAWSQRWLPEGYTDAPRYCGRRS